MGLISIIGPYLALLSLLVSCVPGVYWLFKKTRQSRQSDPSGRNQQLYWNSLPTNRQYLSSTILLEEPLFLCYGLLLPTVSNGTRDVSSTSQPYPTYSRPRLELESQAPRLDTTCFSQNAQVPVELPTEQCWGLNSRPPYGPRLSQGVDPRYYP